MPKMQNSQSVEPHQMVEPLLFDIHLRDSCDTELYSPDEYLKNEKSCSGDNVAFDGDDNDVILVEGEKEEGKNEDEEMEEPALDPEVEAAQHQNSFLQYFELCKSAVPITSPAGQQLILQSNALVTNEYIRERIERYGRFCAAPPLAPDGSNRPKFMNEKVNNV